MENVEKLPEWLGTAVVGAIIAALGYVATLFLEWLRDFRTGSLNRRAELAELLSILRAGEAAYLVQSENRNRLHQSISQRDPQLAGSVTGYERLFTAAYPQMTEDEKDLHLIVRSITVNTLKPLNESILEWLRKDRYFKARTWGAGLRAQLARRLAVLETHLLLWRSKYEVWIPQNLAHSLVYLEDEEKHGVGFPKGIDDEVQHLLTKRWWIGS